MAKINPIQDINIRKQMMKLQIRQQELEIQKSLKELGDYFTVPTLKNVVVDYVVQNPETTIKVGLIAFSLINKAIRGRKRRSSRRK